MIKKLKKVAIIMTLTGTAIMLNSCDALKYKPVDAREFPPEPDKRVQKNIEEGKGFRIFDMNKNNSGTFDFASSNELWRASLEIIDFIPLVSANYSGGIIITDWYTDNSNKESIKITIKFLSNEIESTSLDVQIFKKYCETIDNCKITQEKGTLVAEIKKKILQKATIYEKQKKDKNFKPYKMSKPSKNKQ
tara:strand:- start:1048 stop:1620 length:573 start_codon:yes stop_codon:yes gene_type:complete